MTSFRIALSELRRLTATRLGVVAVLALVLVPTLYAGLYLYANHDPYGALSRVPAAIVNRDTGTTLSDGTELRAGDEVTTELVDSASFDWHEVTLAEAQRGVKDGDFDFALVIPPGFSAAFGSTSDLDPTQARLAMITNDANSYLATSIADKVADQVRESVSTNVTNQAVETLLANLETIRTSLVDAADGADELASGIVSAHDGAGDLADGASDLDAGAAKLDAGATTLAKGLTTLKNKTSDLGPQTRRLATGARKVAAGNAKIAGIGRQVGAAAADVRAQYAAGRSDLRQALNNTGLTKAEKKRILAVYDDLGAPVRQANTTVQGAVKDLNRLAAGAGKVADGNEALAAAVPSLVNGIASASDGADTLAEGTDSLATGAHKLAEGADTLNTGLARLQRGSKKLASGLHDGADQIPSSTEDSRSQLAQTISEPVRVTNSSEATAGSYGAGLAPFFLALAAWIGGYVLFTQVVPLSRRAMAANQTPLRVALGGWMAPAALGAVQMIVALTVVSIGVDIVPANVPATLLFMVLCSAVFVAIVHALCAWFGLAGQFLGLVMMVVQLVTAGGTFPWQTIPEPLHPVHHLMPMSYAVDGMRQLMYGGLDTRVWTDVGVLALWFAIAVFASARAARRQRVWTVKTVATGLGG